MEAKFCAGITDGKKCPHLALPSSEHCQKCQGQPLQDKEVPSSLSNAAAIDLLSIPILMGQISETMRSLAVQMEEMNQRLLQVVAQIPQRPVQPVNFFLNEAHELPRITKSQARRERTEAKKAREAKDATASSGSRPRRKSPAARRSS